MSSDEDDFVFTPLRQPKKKKRTIRSLSATQPASSNGRKTSAAISRISSTQQRSTKQLHKEKEDSKPFTKHNGNKPFQIASTNTCASGSRTIVCASKNPDLQPDDKDDTSDDSFEVIRKRKTAGSRNETEKTISLSSNEAMSPIPRQSTQKTKESESDKCPICQVPLSLLSKKASVEHASTCEKVDWSSKPACRDGMSCISTSRSHYLDFSHRASLCLETPEKHSNTSIGNEGGFLRSPIEAQKSDTPVSNQSISLLHSMDDEAILLQLTQRKSFESRTREDFISTEVLERTSSDKKALVSATPSKVVEGQVQSFDSNDSTFPAVLRSSGSKEASGPSGYISAPSLSLQETIPLRRTVSSKSNDSEVQLRTDRVAQWISECSFPPICEGDERDPSEGSDIEVLKSISVAGSPMKKRKCEPSPAKSEKQTVITSYFSCKEAVVPQPKESEERQSVRVTNSVVSAKAAWSSIMEKMRKDGGVSKEAPMAYPPYKIIKGTTFAVDAFSYGDLPGVTEYFLTHFHYDHYVGLKRSFAFPLYCSRITGKLVALKIGIRQELIRTINVGQTVKVNGVDVTALEANHCPGAVMFLFALPDGRKMLHTGDFRASVEMEQYEKLRGADIDSLYLDTTFCDKDFDFPPQEKVISTAVSIAKQHYAADKKLLIVVGSYLIGKERLYEAIACALDIKIWVDRDKKQILQCLEYPSITKRLVDDPNEAQLHVLPMGGVNVGGLNRYLTEFSDRFSSVVAFKPTGWEYTGNFVDNVSVPTSGNKKISINAVPYSEHSSYSELKRFVRFLKPKGVIPTVNADTAAGRKKLERSISSWKVEESGSVKAAKQLKMSTFVGKKKS